MPWLLAKDTDGQTEKEKGENVQNREMRGNQITEKHKHFNSRHSMSSNQWEELLLVSCPWIL